MSSWNYPSVLFSEIYTSMILVFLFEIFIYDSLFTSFSFLSESGHLLRFCSLSFHFYLYVLTLSSLENYLPDCFSHSPSAFLVFSCTQVTCFTDTSNTSVKLNSSQTNWEDGSDHWVQPPFRLKILAYRSKLTWPSSHINWE